MIKIDVPIITKDNSGNEREELRQEVFYNSKDFPYDKLIKAGCPLVSQNTHNNRDKKTILYYNIECAFDIETTTLESLEDQGIHSPFAFMYLGAFCIGSDCVYFRNWKDFINILERLRDNLELNYHKRLLIYVFNLPFEFEFTKNFVRFVDVFGKKKRQPIKCFAEDYGIEFRCAWALTNMKFDDACRSSAYVMHRKVVGSNFFPDFNYKKIRTPYTKIEDHEMAYMYNDVRGLCELIKEHRLGERSGKVTDIPLTSTSYSRRLARKEMQKNKLNKIIQKRMALNAEEFSLLQECNRGGYTHANNDYFNQTIDTGWWSYDMKSAYLFDILCMGHPMSKLMPVDPANFYNYIDDPVKCCFFRVVFRDLKKKTNFGMPYISFSKCRNKKDKVRVVQDSGGGIIAAKQLELSICDLDFRIIRDQYTWNDEEFFIKDLYICKKDYLPQELRNTVLKLFSNKCFYENKDKALYNHYKKLANCVFGMMVTSPIPDLVEYDPESLSWESYKPKEAEEIEAALKAYYESYTSFTSYQWGVYVTAGVRYLLFQAIFKLGEKNVYYCDTDCVKFKKIPGLKEKMEEVNEYIWSIAEAAPTLPEVEVDGKIYRMGLFCEENEAIRAYVVGQKQYCVEYIDDETGEVYSELTVAGLDKAKGSKELNEGNGLDDFYIGKTFESAGKPMAYVNDLTDMIRITVQGKSFWTGSNIALVTTPYTLGKTNNYKDILSKK